MAGLEATTLTLTLSVCASLPIAHGMLERLWLRRRPHVSPQIVLIRLAFGWCLLLIGSALLLFPNATPRQDLQNLAMAGIYTTLVYAATAYAYFHIFNLSETGRRIRILMQLRDPSAYAKTSAERRYSPQDMLRSRLIRLHRMGQIRRDAQGRHYIDGRVFLRIGVLLRAVGVLLLGKNRHRAEP